MPCPTRSSPTSPRRAASSTSTASPASEGRTIEGDPARGGDEDLVTAARAGDGAALEALVERHYDRVHALCRRMLGHDADALDATQDALVAAVRGLPRFDGRSAFGTWLYRIATNTCLDELRRRRRRPTVSLDAGPEPDALWLRGPGGGDGWTGGGETGPGGGADPGELGALRADLDAALATLVPEYRAAVVLRDLCDLSYEEIAAVLEVPVGTVRSRIARGRAALAARWGGGGNRARPAVVQPGVSPTPETPAPDREGTPT